jgi:hypothetical protein
MSKNYKILSNQSIIDVSIEVFGSIDAVFDIMKENNYSYDLQKDPAISTNITLPENTDYDNKLIQNYFTKTKQNITTSQPELNIPVQYWILNTGFWDDSGLWDDLGWWNDGIN